MNTLSEFTEEFHEQIHSESIYQEILKEEAFVCVMGDILSECGDSETIIGSPYISVDKKTQIDGYSYDEEEDTLCLLRTHWLDKTNLENCKVKDSDISKAFEQASNFLKRSLKGGFKERIEESNEAHDLSDLIFNKKGRLKKVKFILITDGMARKKPYEHFEEDGIGYSRIVWDIERTHYYYKTGREEINVDFTEYCNGPLKCTKVKTEKGKYTTYLGFIPGTVLADLYAKWEMKMLDLNVRVFLSRRGKVNSGIHETIKHVPWDFCAYNNGITVFATEITPDEKETGILKAEGFQVVNGGQTTASLFWAREEGTDINDIIVQMKLTVIHDNKRVDELVAKMSEYSNTQNKVSPVDQHAKLYPHPQLAYISHNTPAPADGSLITFWFYERMRGSYAERRRLTARTQSQKVAFDLKHPTSQKFDRIKFGKVWNAYKGRPDIVCLGGQKSFVPYNLWLTEYTSDGESDLTIFFKETVALLIIWNAVDSKNMVKKKIDGEKIYKGYNSQIIAYSISWFFECAKKKFKFIKKEIDLEKIWGNQKVPPAIIDTLEKMFPLVDSHIRDTDLDVGEYCKKKICWDKLKEKEFELDEKIQEECTNINRQQDKPQIMPDEEAIEFCMGKGADAWWKLYFHARDERLFTKTAISMCRNMASILGNGNDPSSRLSLPCMQMWKTAVKEHNWEYEKNKNN